MKKRSPTSKSTAKDSDIKRAVGGQPESDQDAREAGLKSATSAKSAGNKSRTKPASRSKR